MEQACVCIEDFFQWWKWKKLEVWHVAYTDSTERFNYPLFCYTVELQCEEVSVVLLLARKAKELTKTSYCKQCLSGTWGSLITQDTSENKLQGRAFWFFFILLSEQEKGK